MVFILLSLTAYGRGFLLAAIGGEKDIGTASGIDAYTFRWEGQCPDTNLLQGEHLGWFSAKYDIIPFYVKMFTNWTPIIPDAFPAWLAGPEVQVFSR